MIPGLSRDEWDLLSEEQRRVLAYNQQIPEPVQRARQQAAERAFQEWRKQDPGEDPHEREKARAAAYEQLERGTAPARPSAAPVGRDDMGWMG